MKKTLSCAFIAVLLFTIFSGAFTFSAKEQMTINVYNWGEYLSNGTDDTLNVNKAFEEATGIKVNYSTYDSNEVMYSKLAMGSSNYDIIIPSDYMIGRLVKEDKLEKLNFDNIPNYKYISDDYKKLPYDRTGEYSVPYTYGMVGIIYNTKYVKKPVDSWEILWDSEYKGKILMFDNPRDAFGIAQLYLNQDINTTKTADYDACFKKLVEQKPLVQSYVMDQIFDKMKNEEAYIAPYYAGDFYTMNQDNPDLAFALPKEGYNCFVDGICIPKGAKNKEAAEKYIDFLCKPEIAGKNADYHGYAIPNEEAKAYMDEGLAASTEIYAPRDKFNFEDNMFENLPDETLKYSSELWSKVKMDSNFNWLWVILIGSAVIGVLVVIIVVRASKKKLYRD